MDTPLVDVVHKENVHIGGGKATVTMKPDKLKTAKTDGEKRKPFAELRSTNLPVVGALKDVNLKQKSTVKGNGEKKDQMTQGKRSKLTVEEIKQCYGLAPFNQILTDEQIKQCYEWANDGIDEMGGLSWSAEDEANLLKSQIGLPGSEFYEPFTSEVEEGYETDESDFKISAPGRLSSVYTPEEQDNPLGVARIGPEDCYPLPPLPELKLDDD